MLLNKIESFNNIGDYSTYLPMLVKNNEIV